MDVGVPTLQSLYFRRTRIIKLKDNKSRYILKFAPILNLLTQRRLNARRVLHQRVLDVHVKLFDCTKAGIGR